MAASAEVSNPGDSLCHRLADDGFTAAVAPIFLSLRLGSRLPHHRTVQRLAGRTHPADGYGPGRLATCDGLVYRMSHLRVFLGDVELLFLSQMDLPYHLCRLTTHF